MGLTGGQIVCEMLRRQNVDSIFGYSGGAILPVFDALYGCPHFRFVLLRHEQGAGHMEQGYSRASRKPGVVLTTSGPGATNLITTLQDALKDGTPLVVLTGEVATNAMGTDAFQEADVIGITGPCTKWNPVSGRKGPVLVALPKDVTNAVLEAPAESSSFHWGLPKLDNPIFELMPSQPTDQRALNDARILLTKLRKPLYTQVTECFRAEGLEVLAQLAETACLPVATSILGIGCFDEHDFKSLRMLGMHGTRFDDRAVGDPNRFAPVARAAGKDQRGGYHPL
ncbi:Thiamine pyrophosphate enzyme C-terminal TPP-binding [Penicillium samsonianum]|uniref:Thiamine pyrophosphate enzyme C-terminal TPP-binding n=1 Tax=Penicillium samsonianum TaxID=1882272 RepID=UPI0025493808|nr:Thiamine pyrophosphate enzyme C-terminal TPP-binding [Penicillium samsonianum]KAJ6150368.1 Thiamine pyrophosphate enzyme C-terminal TPP-binding [Penicillium samsonianum]